MTCFSIGGYGKSMGVISIPMGVNSNPMGVISISMDVRPFTIDRRVLFQLIIKKCTPINNRHTLSRISSSFEFLISHKSFQIAM